MPFPTDPAESAQYTQQLNNVNVSVDNVGADLEVIHITYTHDEGAGVGEIELLRLDPGRLKIYPHLSLLAHSAFVATADLDIGFRSYKQKDGTVVAENGVQLFDSIDAGGGALALTAWPSVTGASAAVAASQVIEFEAAGPGVEGVYCAPEDAGLRMFASVDTANIEDGDTIEIIMVVSRST